MVQIIKSNWWWGSWWGGGGEWDMKRSVYDPNNLWKNVYDYTYFINKPTIPTKTSDLDNDSDFVDSSDLSTALAGKQDTLTAWTGIDITSNVISATGGGWSGDVVWPSSSTNWHLAAFDWTTGKLIKDGGEIPNTKTFYIDGTWDANFAVAWDACNWVAAGNVAYIYDISASTSTDFPSLYVYTSVDIYSDHEIYTFTSPATTIVPWTTSDFVFDADKIKIIMHEWAAYSINIERWQQAYYLSTSRNYSSPYNPQYPWSPATKKYIDDKIISSSTAPSSPTEWMVWYDTTNDVLKTYDGSNWNEVWWGGWGWEWNTKTFYLSDTSDTTNAQAALDWYLAGKNPIVVLSDIAYIVVWYLSTQLTMMSFYFWVTNYKPSYSTQSYSQTAIYRLEINISSGSVTYITNSNTSSIGGTYLSPWVDYPTPYLPEYEWSPATKKYVDDNVAVFYSPSNDTSDLNSDVWPYMASWLTSTGQLPLDKTTYKDCVIVIWNNVYSRRIVCDITATEDDHSSIRLQFCNIRSVTTSNYTSWTNVWTSRTNVPVIYMNFTYYSGVWTYVSSENNRQFWTSPYVLATNYNYSTPYTPQYPWSPTTKKYVDDKLTTDATTPSSPTEWMIWYDSTNHQLKYYDGSNWKTVTAS